MSRRDEIQKLILDGKTNDEIAKVFPIDRHQLSKEIRLIKKRLGIYAPIKQPDVDVDKIAELRQQGFSVKAISDIIGEPVSCIDRILKKNNIQKSKHTKKRIEQFNVILPLFEAGLSREDISDECKLSIDAVSTIMLEFGYSFRKRDSKNRSIKVNEILDLCNAEMSAKQIADTVGMSIYNVYRIANQNGHVFVDRECHDDISELRRSGCSISEICLITGKDRKLVSHKCRTMGLRVTKEEKEESKKIVTQKITHSEDWARQYIHEKTDGRLEYVSGYINMDSDAIVTCTNCGRNQSRRFSIFRGTGHPVCLYCQFGKNDPNNNPEIVFEREKRKKEKELKKEKEQEKKRIEKESAKLIKAGRGKQLSFSFCDCGEMIDRFDGWKGKQCKRCAKRALNKNKEIRRRKITKVMVDSDITLQKLYRRDKGICYLCGELCDWDDKEIRENVIICGNQYPSIDHVIPLAKGGLHSWDNIKLAHRMCNSLKGDDYDEENMENTDNKSNGDGGNLPRVI